MAGEQVCCVYVLVVIQALLRPSYVLLFWGQLSLGFEEAESSINWQVLFLPQGQHFT